MLRARISINMKLRVLTIFILLISTQITFAQHFKLTDEQLNNSTTHKLTFADTTNCGEVNGWFKSDTTNKTIFLFLQGGFVPVIFSTDSTFENKYNVYFYDFGDVGLPSDKCVIAYDNMVFDYLTIKYGKQWIRKLRKDVIGFNDWKKAYKKSRH